MTFIHFGLTGIGGGVHRKGDGVVLIFGFLFFTVGYFGGGARRWFIDAFYGLAEDREWMIKNSKTARLLRKKDAARVRAKEERRVREKMNYLFDELTLSQQLNIERSQKNYELERDLEAIKRRLFPSEGGPA